ncbi:hypothetical protein ACFPVX_00320 [Cohnella faecalis]|uniref:NEAT domain-containing protein n=1 Tax=Cohnella faecalis TaxID=2315694 RepID=A0A398CIM6_9BACL|nr:hypothetical protein [Cohnella faecalis]RIE02235.1 hypothetical protein D3H35_15990 [Cohnella faecalis]
MSKISFFNKKSIALLMALALVLSFALPASAAPYSAQFLDSSGSPSAHASSYIDGGVVDITGSAGNYTVTLKLKNFEPSFPLIPISYPSLYVDLNGAPTGDGTYEVAASKTVSGSYTYFTFSGVANLTDNLPVLLHVNVAGIHNQQYNLFLDY